MNLDFVVQAIHNISVPPKAWRFWLSSISIIHEMNYDMYDFRLTHNLIYFAKIKN